MQRYKVIRHWFKYKKKLYHVGELLPVEFTERDQYRNTFPSRVILVDVAEDTDVVKNTLPEETVTITNTPVISIPVKIVAPVALAISIPVNVSRISVPVGINKISTGISAITNTKGITPAGIIGARVNNAITGTQPLSNSSPKK